MQRPFGTVDQVGYVVPDIDKAIQTWIDCNGTGPWLLIRNIQMHGRLNGQPATISIHAAMAQQGDVQIELIQDLTEGPSQYKDADGKLLFGQHHLGFIVDDIDPRMQLAHETGWRTVFESEMGSAKIAYLERLEDPGVLFEFIQSAETRAMVEEAKRASKNWDGSNAVTVIDSSLQT